MRSVCVCAVIAPVVNVTQMEGWSSGPMPWDWPVTRGRNDDQRDTTTGQLRRTVLRDQAADILYGPSDDLRHHRRITNRQVLGWTVDAVELVTLPGPAGDQTRLFVTHLSAPPEADIPTGLSQLADVAPERTTNTRDALNRLIGEMLLGARLRGERTDRHAYVVSHTAFSAGMLEVTPPRPESDTPAHLQWSRLLASVNSAAAMSVELLAPDQQAFDLALSESWCATILKRGAAFVARTPQESDSFHPTGRALVRSIYLDAVLLALMQQEIVHHLTESVPGLLKPETRLADRLALQRRLIEYRAVVWSQDIAESRVVNDVLTAAQRQFNLHAKLDELATDIADLAQVSQLEADRRITRLLNWLVAVSAGAGIATLLWDPGWGTLFLGVVLAVVIAVSMQGYTKLAERTR